MLSLLYLVVRALVRLLVSGGQRGRDDGSKDLEILVLGRPILPYVHFLPSGPAVSPDWPPRVGIRVGGTTMTEDEFTDLGTFFTVETAWLRTLYVLVFIELGSRRILLSPSTVHPDSAWVTQQARNLALNLDDRSTAIRFLIHDRDTKFSRSFDEVVRSEGARVILTPIRAPNANAYAERVIATIRAECLDWSLILGRRHLDRTLRTYAEHYNRGRPHRSRRRTSREGEGANCRFARKAATAATAMATSRTPQRTIGS